MTIPERIRPETGTLMHAEAAEAGAAVARFLAANADTLALAGARLRALAPAVVVTCARGSSDHAATYGGYLIETLVGVPVSSAGLSVASLYKPVAPANHGSTVCIAVSQSGRSPDLLATVDAHQRAGALVIAIVNDAASPLAVAADILLPLAAGPELSVAATKSFIVSLVALAALTAAWANDDHLTAALATLPETLPRAFALDWSNALPTLAGAASLFTIGRGYGLAIAQEAALKLKETCALHGEAFSSAEVRHGPMAIVGPGFPVLAFAGSDVTGTDVRMVSESFAERGAIVLLADARAETVEGRTALPVLPGHPAVEPILAIQSFYRFVNQLSLARGLDPDAPPHLAKVTRTQ